MLFFNSFFSCRLVAVLQVFVSGEPIFFDLRSAVNDFLVKRTIPSNSSRSFESPLTSSMDWCRGCRMRMAGRASIGHPQSPANRFKVHFANVGVIPRFFGMAKCRVEDAAFAVHLAPRDSEIMIRAMYARIVGVVELGWIETQENIHLVARPSFGLIDFVVFYEGFRKMAHRGEVGILIHDWRVERHPRVLVEPATDHLSIFGPVVVRVQRRVNSDESFAVVVDKRQDVLLLAVI